MANARSPLSSIAALATVTAAAFGQSVPAATSGPAPRSASQTAAASQSTQGSQPATQSASEVSIEDEVLANLRSLPSGDHTLADWNFPEKFLRRVADRVIRASYERNFRRVVHDRPPESQPATASAPASQPVSGRTATIVESQRDQEALAHLTALREMRPALRSFRVPLRSGDCRLPAEPPTEATDPTAAATAKLVGRELASRGLLRTTALAMESLGPACLDATLTAESEPQRESILRSLAGTGIPVDWLAAFASAGDGPAAEFATIQRIASELRAGRRGAELDALLDQMSFRPRPSLDRFALATESGEHDFGGVYVQLSRASDWLAVGDGGAIDVLRQLVSLTDSAALHVLATQDDASAVMRGLRNWPAARDARVTIHRSPLPVAQWAQDNQKFGLAGGTVRRIVPRYPTRGEDGATFVPGEAVWGCLDASAVQSPLLFQGGNLICIRDERRKERVLLLGEAEVHRNVALGLAPPQVLEAFRVEMGVDRCVVLPAASFHIDFEITFRTIDGAPVALVNDADAARRIILSCGIDALQRGGVLPESDAQIARRALADRNVKEFINVVGRGLIGQAVNFGIYPERLGDKLSTGAADSGTGNLLLFLYAMDSLLAMSLADAEVPPDRPSGYVRAIRRDAADRAKLQNQLCQLGWRTVGVPGISNGQRGITYVNGIHTPAEYWMPTWGGLYAPLDDAAAAAFQSALGPTVKIVPIRTSETQRRGGGLHCALAVAPAATPR